MDVDSIEIWLVELPLVEEHRSGYGQMLTKETCFVTLGKNGKEGWGECSSFTMPTYAPQWSRGEFCLISDVIDSVGLRTDALEEVLGHSPAKAAFQQASIELENRLLDQTLFDIWPISASRIACSVAISLGTCEEIKESVSHWHSLGCRSFKFKVIPDSAIETVETVQNEFPDLRFGIDANGTFARGNKDHCEVLERVARMGIDFIEQPFGRLDYIAHREFNSRIPTPIMLDESIQIEGAADVLIEMGCCDGLTIKPGLVGGPTQTHNLAKSAQESGVFSRIGGMLDSAIARRYNVALAALDVFKGAPAEVSPDGRWYENSFNSYKIEMRDGCLDVADCINNFEIDRDLIEAHKVLYKRFEI